MAASNPVLDQKQTRLNSGRFQGSVVDNKDPLKQQRVRIRIPALHRGIPDNMLPWSRPHMGDPHAGGGVGGVDVPVIGTLVNIWFDEDDPHNPIYGGSVTVDEVHKDNPIAQDDNYPDVYGKQDSAGNIWKIDKQRNEVTFQHKTGATIFIDGAGNIHVTPKGTLYLSSPKKVDIASNANIEIHSSGSIEIRGNPVHIISGGSGGVSAPPARATPVTKNPAGQTKL